MVRLAGLFGGVGVSCRRAAPAAVGHSRAMAPLSSVPAGTTREGDGIVVGDGPVRIDAFIDFLCPYCRAFEQRAGATLDRLLAEGRVTIVYHPVGFLDRLSAGTRYSTRAAAAAGAAADAGGFAAFKDALFAAQPEEGGPGLRAAGIDGPAFGESVHSGRYLDWVADVSERAAASGVDGIPTVFVAGARVEADGEPIAAAVAAAG
jgi:protein-disulfide isomerase